MGDGRKADYLKKTQDLLNGLIPADIDGRSWLDHVGAQASLIDKMILAGKYTIMDIAKAIYEKQPPERIKPIEIMKRRVNKHIDHLRDKFNGKMAPHYFQVKIGHDNIVRFDFVSMGLYRANNT